MTLTLLSRTVGADRVVDEFHVWFKHTHEIPWMLPGVPPTDKRVEVLVVSIVALKGGKIYHEHVYWDQASVLYQIGLLEPKLGPVTSKKTGVERLPVVGREAARRVLRSWEDEEDGAANNKLITGWGGSAFESGEKGGEDESEANTKPTGGVQGAAKREQTNGGNPPTIQKIRKEPQQQTSSHKTDATTSKDAAIKDQGRKSK